MSDCALNGFFNIAQRTRLLGAVAKRVSVRTYCAPPDVAQMSALHFASARVCLPGVRIAFGECADSKLYRTLPFVAPVVGTDRYAAIIADLSAPHAKYYAGASGEAFILEAVALGLGTCWIASFKRPAVDIEVNANERVLAVTPLGESAEEGTRERKRKQLRDICTSDPATWPIYAFNAAECVRVAPSAVNLQPWLLSYAGRTLMLTKKPLGGELDMGIALLHMSLGVGERKFKLQFGEGREIATMVVEESNDAV